MIATIDVQHFIRKGKKTAADTIQYKHLLDLSEWVTWVNAPTGQNITKLERCQFDQSVSPLLQNGI